MSGVSSKMKPKLRAKWKAIIEEFRMLVSCRSAFLRVGQPGATAAYLVYQYRTWDVAENLGRFLVRSVHRRGMILN